MGQIIKIFLVDLKRRLKRPLSIIITMCIPLAMSVIIGSVFGRSGDVELPKITMLLVDNDDAVLSMFLRQGLGQGTLGDMIEGIDKIDADVLTLCILQHLRIIGIGKSRSLTGQVQPAQLGELADYALKLIKA